jgi:Na+/alanine symporter
MIQSNSIASNLNDTFGVPNWVTDFLLTMICGFMLQGSIERISAVVDA